MFYEIGKYINGLLNLNRFCDKLLCLLGQYIQYLYRCLPAFFKWSSIITDEIIKTFPILPITDRIDNNSNRDILDHSNVDNVTGEMFSCFCWICLVNNARGPSKNNADPVVVPLTSVPAVDNDDDATVADDIVIFSITNCVNNAVLFIIKENNVGP